MRLFLLLISFPFLLTAQSDTTVQEEQENFFQRSRFRVGLHLQRDGRPRQLHTFKGDMLVLNYQRQALPSITIGGQPFSRLPFLRFQLRAAYADHQYEGKSTSKGSYSGGYSFQENINYEAWQLAVGVQVELSPSTRISPYATGHFFLSVPTHLRYEVFRAYNNLSSELPAYAEAIGGARVSPGWEIAGGLRAIIGKKSVLLLGGYYSEYEIPVDWPEVEIITIDNILMRSTGLGYSLTWQYEW